MAATSAGGKNLNNILIVGLLLVGAILGGGYWFLQKRTLDSRKETVEQRKREAEKLESIIKDVEEYQKRKDSLQNRIDLINQLKQNQRGPVRVMDRISQDLPDLVWLDNMSIAGGRVTVNGRALNPNAVANFVENIKKDDYFEEPEVGAVSQVSATPLVYSFDMNFGFSYTPKGAAAPGDATGTAGTAGTAGTSATSATTGTPGTAKR